MGFEDVFWPRSVSLPHFFFFGFDSLIMSFHVVRPEEPFGVLNFDLAIAVSLVPLVVLDPEADFFDLVCHAEFFPHAGVVGFDRDVTQHFSPVNNSDSTCAIVAIIQKTVFADTFHE